MIIAVIIAEANAIRHTKKVNIMRISINVLGFGAQGMPCDA